jgi:hypothetical protein
MPRHGSRFCPRISLGNWRHLKRDRPLLGRATPLSQKQLPAPASAALRNAQCRTSLAPGQPYAAYQSPQGTTRTRNSTGTSI